MPDVEAANIAHNLLRALGGVSSGPAPIGAARSAHIVTEAVTVRGLVDNSARADAEDGARA